MKKIINFGIASVAIVLTGLVGLVLIAPTASAQTPSPTFNNDWQDYKTLRVSNYTKNPNSSTNWTTTVYADNGDVISFMIYYHNTVSGSTAGDTRVRVSFPTGYGASITPSATLWAQNANPLGDTAYVVSNAVSQRLEYEAGSTRFYPNQNSATSQPLPYGQNGSEIVSANGLRIGDIAGGWPTQGYVVFRARLIPETIAVPTVVPTVTLNSNPSQITPGQNATLSWSSANATSCSASGGWSGSKSLSGSEIVYPSVTTSYVLTCSGTGGQASTQATVTVSGNPAVSINQRVENVSYPNGGSTSNNAWPGNTLRYIFDITNTGNAALSNVELGDYLSSNLEFLSATNGGYYNSSQNRVVWNPGTLTAGASVNSLSFTARVKGGATGNYQITNRGQLTSNLVSAESNQVTTAVLAPQVSVSVSANRTDILPGGEVVYYVSILNNGSSPATDVTATVTLPFGLTIIEAPGASTISGNVISYRFPIIVAGSRQDITIRTRALSGLNPYSILVVRVDVSSRDNGAGAISNASNSYSLTVRNGASVPFVPNIIPPVYVPPTANANVPSDQLPQINLVLQANPDRVKAGEEVSYALAAVNGGRGIAKNVSVKIEIPDEMTVVESGDGFTPNGSGFSYNLGDLNANIGKAIAFKLKTSKDLKNENYLTVTATASYADKNGAVQPEIATAATIVAEGPRTLTALLSDIFSGIFTTAARLIFLIIAVLTLIAYFLNRRYAFVGNGRKEAKEVAVPLA
ncbi:MAG: DUF11 domain-containing protein [Parcubacteria group bacterium]|nr:DUF11 domain-containing protein [Parcubacteria group bacterium]